MKVRVHQGSVLSPLLFIILLEALSREFWAGVPWEDLYADYLVIIAQYIDTVIWQYIDTLSRGMYKEALDMERSHGEEGIEDKCRYAGLSYYQFSHPATSLTRHVAMYTALACGAPFSMPVILCH